MMKNDVMAILSLNEDHIKIRELTKNRPLASLPIAGRYRVIDFILSNITNAHIYNVGVYAQRKVRSLNDHLGDGFPWDLDRLQDGLFVFSPQTDINEKRSLGDLSIIYENIDFISRSKQEYVIIATPFMLYNINFNDVFESHINSNAKITALYKHVDNAHVSFYDCYVYSINNSKISSIGKNMCSRKEQNISMECFIMKKNEFLSLIYGSIESGQHIYLIDAINKFILENDTNLYKFNGYVKCVKDIKSYREFNSDILNEDISNEIFRSPNGLIYTKIKDEAPTYFSSDSKVENSVIASGCIIEGSVKNSVIFRKVRIAKGAIVENCIIMQNSIIGENTYINHMISDKNITISNGKKLIGDFNMPILVKKGDEI